MNISRCYKVSERSDSEIRARIPEGKQLEKGNGSCESWNKLAHFMKIGRTKHYYVLRAPPTPV
jgi:hypothetical protein